MAFSTEAVVQIAGCPSMDSGKESGKTIVRLYHMIQIRFEAGGNLGPRLSPQNPGERREPGNEAGGGGAM